MKALFKSHFPFVEGSAEELTPDQKLIKQTYDKLYPIDIVPVDTISEKDSGSNTKAKTKGN